MRPRFYLQLYAALLGSAFVCLLVTGIAFRVARDAGGPPAERMQEAARVLPDRLPDVRAADARARVAAVADELGVDIIAGDSEGAVVGAPGPRAFPIPRHLAPGLGRDRVGPVLLISLGGDGWAALRPRVPYRRLRTHPFFTTLAILAVVMAVGAYPVARRVTRRLESLATEVERWGAGELHARVPVDGRDEIALLAATFNRAAERLDLVLAQQRQMLATASHELRSPLARLRMGLELIADEPDAGRRRARAQEIHGDIVELDGLIEELLLYARADGRVPRRPPEAVELRSLLADEAARAGAAVAVAVEGPAVTVHGDATMLRHLVRNLLENAQLHGAPVAARAAGAADSGPAPAVRAALVVEGAQVRVSVEDDGPGIPAEDRERVFAPCVRRPSAGGATPGHGMGLAFVRQVARYHGGEATCRVGAGGGSRFEVTLPLTD
jgi:signal transduction histidine kinase